MIASTDPKYLELIADQQAADAHAKIIHERFPTKLDRIHAMWRKDLPAELWQADPASQNRVLIHGLMEISAYPPEVWRAYGEWIRALAQLDVANYQIDELFKLNEVEQKTAIIQ